MSARTGNIPRARKRQPADWNISRLARHSGSRGRVVDGGRVFRKWAPLPLRLVVGYGFMAHGYAKLANGPERFAASLHGLGVPAPHLMAWVTIVLELAGGFAVLLGAWIWAVSLPLAAILMVAAIT